GLCKETQRFFAAFAADAALFHAAERNAKIANEPAIYPDGAGVDSLGDAMGAAQVLRPNARRQTVFDVIGVIDHFFFAVERRDCYDGSENFFSICAARNRQASNDGRLEEITVAATLVGSLGRGTAKRDFAAFFLREIDVELYFLELRLVHDRDLLGFFIQRVAQAQLCRSFDEALDKILVSRSLDKHARSAQADLSLVRER